MCVTNIYNKKHTTKWNNNHHNNVASIGESWVVFDPHYNSNTYSLFCIWVFLIILYTGSVIGSALLSYSLTCSLAFGPEATNPMQIMFSVLRGTRPDTSLHSLPADIPSRETLIHLMTSGWAANPDDRPSFLSKCRDTHTHILIVDHFLTLGSRPSVRNECSAVISLCWCFHHMVPLG